MKKLFPYFVLTVFIILWWKLSTDASNYAWNPKGKELLILELSLQTIFIYKTCFWLLVMNTGLFASIHAFKKKYAIALVATLIGTVIFFFGNKWVDRQLAQPYFTVFINQSVDEENIEKPIIESGYHVGEYLTPYIQQKDARYRRYAISGLGKIKYNPAIGPLQHIVNDSTEQDFIRADALSALKEIGTNEATSVIESYHKGR